MNTKSVPEYVTNAALARVLKMRWATLASYWIFQGILMMDNYERGVKILFDILTTLILYSAAVGLSAFKTVPALITAFIVSHTLNMFLNGHFPALGKFLGFAPLAGDKFNAYVKDMIRRWDRKAFVRFVAAYGSAARGEMSSRSDFDVRVLPKPGFTDKLKCALWIAAERSRALFKKFPLDIYLISDISGLKKMRPEETPLLLVQKEEPSGCFSAYKVFDEKRDISRQ